MNFRKTTYSNTPSGTNLRNIINDVRSNKYSRLKDRINVNRSPNNYFEKLKKKIDFSDKYRPQQKNISRFYKPLTNQKISKKQKNHIPFLSKQYIEQLRIQTQMNTINHPQNQIHVDTSQLNNFDLHNRTNSLIGNISQQFNQTFLADLQNHQKTDRLSKNHNIQRSRKKKRLDQQILQIKAQILNRQRTSSQKTLSNLNQNKNKKHEYINYEKYSPILSDQQASENWGKILLKDVLGVGAHACVRLGVCKNLEFAVKIYEKYKLLEPRKKKRVYKQIQVLKNIPSHPNIISLVEAFQDNKQIHMIFENVQKATTLHQYFRNNMLYLPQKQIKLIFYRLARGIMHLHSHQIAHRDVKPDNVLIGQDEDGEMLVKIIDLGFATSSKMADLHCGTPNFMAPELLQKGKRYDPLSVDIWALGITLFYLCQGRFPFRGYDQKDLFRSIRKCEFSIRKIQSPFIKDIIEKTLVSQPSQRLTIKDLIKHEWFLYEGSQ